MSLDPSHTAAFAVIALAVSAVAMSITQGSIFAPFRTWIAARSTILSGVTFRVFLAAMEVHRLRAEREAKMEG